MKITLVTPSFNQGQFIEETILSVLNQKHKELEYIVVDGGSSDGSATIINKYEKQISWWISEKDNGQAHALNKGFNRLSGDICGYINSDDLLLPGSLSAVEAYFMDNPLAQWAVSDVLLGPSLGHSRLWKAKIPSLETFLCGQSFGQQGVFWRSTALPRPWFDEKLSFALDADFFIRLYRAHGLPGRVSHTTAFFRLHHLSKTTSISHIMYSEGLRLIDAQADIFSQETLAGIKSKQRLNRFLAEQEHLREQQFVRPRQYSGAILSSLTLEAGKDHWRIRCKKLIIASKTFLICLRRHITIEK